MTVQSPPSILDDLLSPYLPFDSSSPLWSDLNPTPQSDITSSSPMCPILYNPPYSSAMDLYRTLTCCNNSALSSPLAAIELSPRALALTSHLIQLNPSHFSVWQYRANILLYSEEWENVEGGRDAVLDAELKWLEGLAHQNMKSYQVWQHRRLVVSALGRPGTELEFVRQNLDRDAKNYHTWGYRQWVLSHFGGLSLALSTTGSSESGGDEIGLSKGASRFPEIWNGEEEYVDKLLQEDVRNNSAWNHRWFIHFSRFGLTGNPSSSLAQHSPEVVQELTKRIRYEIAYTKQSLSQVPNNASAWNFLRALHISFPAPLRTEMEEQLGWVKTLVSSSIEAERDPSVDIMARSSVGALQWWLDTLSENKREREREGRVEEAEKLVKRLIVADPVRKRFYSYRLKTIHRSLVTTA